MAARSHDTRRFLCAVALLLPTAVYGFETIDFGLEPQLLPYTEDGLTFTDLLGNSPMAVAGPEGDRSLVAATLDLPIYVRVEADVPFTLIALDVEGFLRSWELRSSSGEVYDVDEVGTIPFLLQPEWQQIDYFDIVHLPAEPNGSIWLDNVVIEYVPEPTGLALIMVGLTAFLRRRP